MLAIALLCAAQQPALAGAGAPSGLDPLPRSAEELCAEFPEAWKLPRTDRDGQALPSVRFEDSLLRLVREPLAAAAAEGAAPLMFGDLFARAARSARHPELDASRKQLQAVLDDARARVPTASWSLVEPLLDVYAFLSPKWDPDRDVGRSGFLIGETWDLPADRWPRHSGNRSVDQCAVVMAADLACIKLAETNFPGHFLYPKSDYLNVEAVPGSYRVELIPGRASAAGLACAARTAISVDIESDLPFPFGSYSFRLRMLSALNAEQRAITWVYSDSPDFHWMAGYDLYEPVYDGAGRFIGTLVMRQTGLDLDGVPDRSSHHRGGMRSILGGVKRQAEALWREREAAGGFPATGALPVTPVIVR